MMNENLNKRNKFLEFWTIKKIIFPYYYYNQLQKKVEKIQGSKIKNFDVFSAIQEYENYNYYGDLAYRIYLTTEFIRAAGLNLSGARMFNKFYFNATFRMLLMTQLYYLIFLNKLKFFDGYEITE